MVAYTGFTSHPREILNNSRCETERAHISAPLRDVSSWPKAAFVARADLVANG
jgi:hypothetical protein